MATPGSAPVLETVTPDHQRAFIEVQFPVAKLSAEAYKERKGAQGQTLTGLGKWWGRKPLVLVRAIMLGLLLPATNDPQGDRETFLALMTMDEDGLKRRRTKSVSAKQVAEILPRTRTAPFIEKGRWRTGVDRTVRARLQNEAFDSLPYEEKLGFCLRPEEIDGPSPAAWKRINAHLGTSAKSISELVRELGERRYGHLPTVGDAFAGGGSVPFEAARVGCDVYASDINPVAGLLTWAALNIVGGGQKAKNEVKHAQEVVYNAVRDQVEEWGIERNEQGWIAEAYLYCNEVLDPRTGWTVPLAPSWVVARRAKQVVAQLVPNQERKGFDIHVLEGVNPEALRDAETEGTSENGVRAPVNRAGEWLPPSQRTTTSLDQLRGPNGLRLWENDDIVPRPGDVYQERLYCIRWRDPKTGEQHYSAPTEEDLQREARVLELLRSRFTDWQSQGFIPTRRIEPGYNNSQPIRERGWTHWHHLFSPRQLLLAGLMNELAAQLTSKTQQVALTLITGKYADINSKLCRWNSARDQSVQTFYNQALNTLDNYAVRPLSLLTSTLLAQFQTSVLNGDSRVTLGDSRAIDLVPDFWITDPGYGDMVNYDEVSEFFLAWYDKRLTKHMPDWYVDSRRALNIKGEGEPFRIGLTEAYSNLTKHMSDDGYQVIMFTHQDPSVWADVGLTIWAAGLQVVTAWTIATETGATGLRQGNYVQGTVCLILRKRQDSSFGYLSDISPEIEDEVKSQLETMRTLDDDADPSFGDADYQLAAYAAALRVLTSYSEIDEIDIARELRQPRKKGASSPITKLIEQAVEIATNEMVPRGLQSRTWRHLGPDERLYMKGIQVEASGEAREGVYAELARSFGSSRDGFADMLASNRANQTRFKTPSELRARNISDVGTVGFGGSVLRRLLRAVFETAEHEELDPRPARQTLSVDLGQVYWQERNRLIEMLTFLRTQGEHLPHWTQDNAAIDALVGSMRSHNI